MVRTVLQVAAGAADIPVTRLLGQSPAGMSATGESDTRNYYDMISARQEIDLKPQLERLDGLILRSAGLDPAALTFAFRPLWQMDAAERVAVALQKAQATQIYAGLNLWPASITAALVRSQLIEDGTYPGAEGTFAKMLSLAVQPTNDFDPNQPRDPDGRWTSGPGRTTPSVPVMPVSPDENSIVQAQRGLVHLAATTKDFHHACRVLQLDPNEASDALHAAKRAHGLGGADNCVFDLDNGTSSIMANLLKISEIEIMTEQKSRAKSIDMTLRMWSDHIYFQPILNKMNENPKNIHVAGEFIKNDRGREERVAKRHFASIKNARGDDDEAISSWLMEITHLFKLHPQLLANVLTGQIEALLWIAIFGNKSEAMPCLDSQLVTARSQLGLRIIIENYTQFDDEGVPIKLWVS